jgi:phage gp36-like protein
MYYATVEDFLRRYSQEEGIRLTQPGRECHDCIDVTKIEQALRDAFEEINSYRLNRGDRAPWSNATRLMQAQIIIARKNLAQYYDADDPRYRDYKDIIDWLKSYAAGKVDLMPETGGGGLGSLPPNVIVPQGNVAWGTNREERERRYYDRPRRWFRPQ